MAKKKKRKLTKKNITTILCLTIAIISLISGMYAKYNSGDDPAPETPANNVSETELNTAKVTSVTSSEVTMTGGFDLSAVPAYSGDEYVVINDNNPFFSESEIVTESYEYYSDLDPLGRCGVTCACVGKDIMPTEKRGNISSVKPTGWHQNRYDFISTKDLYNRCHLIAHSLAGEDANRQNLITGTRYMNEAMITFEEMVHDYVYEYDTHVMYRVTPVFEGDNLLASGVLMEGFSCEDKGESICFCVYLYNVQPGVVIDYATGENRADDESASPVSSEKTELNDYVLNTKSKKFHTPGCSNIKDIKPENIKEITTDRASLVADGYKPCGGCNP